MRFPWLQVDADFIAARAGELAVHLGVSRREAIGIAVDLWTWALARAPDDGPPDGMVTGTGTVPDRLLSGSVGWSGESEQFSEALIACGLAVRVDSGYRLTGFDRYKATWEKNRRRTGRKPEKNRTGTGEEPARKTQTQTKEESPTRARSVGPTGELADGIAAVMRETDPTWAWDSAKELVLRPLLARQGATATEIIRRLRLAKARKRFPLFTGLADLVRHWDTYATEEPNAQGPPARGRPPRRELNPADYREGPVEKL